MHRGSQELGSCKRHLYAELLQCAQERQIHAASADGAPPLKPPHKAGGAGSGAGDAEPEIVPLPADADSAHVRAADGAHPCAAGKH